MNSLNLIFMLTGNKYSSWEKKQHVHKKEQKQLDWQKSSKPAANNLEREEGQNQFLTVVQALNHSDEEFHVIFLTYILSHFRDI